MKQNPPKRYSSLSEADKQEILNRFLKTKENSVSAISKHLDITESAVHRIINDYLETNRKSTTTSN